MKDQLLAELADNGGFTTLACVLREGGMAAAEYALMAWRIGEAMTAVGKTLQAQEFKRWLCEMYPNGLDPIFFGA